MSTSPIADAARRLKGFWLALRLSRLSPDQIVAWLDSDEHHAELEALMPLDPPRPPSTDPLDDKAEYLAFLRERQRRTAEPTKPTLLCRLRSRLGKRR
jgi:hypothetical protein